MLHSKSGNVKFRSLSQRSIAHSCILIILSLVDGKLGTQIFTEETNWMWLRLSNSEAKARDFAKKCIHNIYVYINIIYILHTYIV